MADVATAIIKFDRDKAGGPVRGAHNGIEFELAVNEEVAVTEGQLAVLTDSGHEFEIISPLGEEAAGEGSPAASLQPDHELSQRTDEELIAGTPPPEEEEPLARSAAKARDDEAKAKAEDDDDGLKRTLKPKHNK